jgi:hypothetical protein
MDSTNYSIFLGNFGMGKRCHGLRFLTWFEACLLKYTAKPYFINIKLSSFVLHHHQPSFFLLNLDVVVMMMMMMEETMMRLMKMTILTLWGLIQVDGTWVGT